MKERKARRIHIVLIVLILLLGAALLFEFSREGLSWFSKEIGEKPEPRHRGYVVVPSYEWEEGDPYEEMERIQRRMDRWFNRVWKDIPGRVEIFEPDIDLTETDSEYIVTCDLPGMEKEKIDISVSGNYLTISGTREEAVEKGYRYKERRSGYFKRTVLLPGPVDENNVKAEYDKGILAISIPKRKPDEEVVPKKVRII